MQFIYSASPVHIALIFHPSTSEEENNGLDAGSRQKLVVIGGGGAQMPNNSIYTYMVVSRMQMEVSISTFIR